MQRFFGFREVGCGQGGGAAVDGSQDVLEQGEKKASSPKSTQGMGTP